MRIKLVVDPSILDRFAALLAVAPRLADFGFEFGQNVQNPDIVLIHDLIFCEQEQQAKLYESVPLIIYERVDAAGIRPDPNRRFAIKRKNVLLWIKRNSFRNPALHNEPYVYGRWHYKLMTKDRTRFPERAQLVHLDESDFAKVRYLPIAIMKFFDQIRGKAIPARNRIIDLSFVGNVDYSDKDPILSAHRRLACHAMADLPNLRTVLGLNRAVEQDLHWEMLYRSRIALSPFGYGEYTYRDYEAILCGAVLLKPNSDHVQNFTPDIYANHEFYVPCEPDFSDLLQRIEMIASSWNAYHQKTLEARELIIRACTPESLVQYLVDLFKDAAIRLNNFQSGHLASPTVEKRNMYSWGEGEPSLDALTATRSKLSIVPIQMPGSNHAIRVAEDGTESNSHELRVYSKVKTGCDYECSFCAKPDGRSSIQIMLVRGGFQNHASIQFDLIHRLWGELTYQGSGFSDVVARNHALDDGWVRCILRFKTLDDWNTNFVLSVSLLEGKNRWYTGDDQSAILISDLRLVREADDATT